MVLGRISLPRHMRVGGGAVRQIGELASDLGITRPLVVTDPFLRGTAVEKVIEPLVAAGLSPWLHSDTVPDPTTDSLQTAVERARTHKPDAVIGFGGGSPIDTAKALALVNTRR